MAELKPEVLGLSALLTTTMPEMQRVIATFQDRGLRDRVKIMVGGAPVDAKLAGQNRRRRLRQGCRRSGAIGEKPDRRQIDMPTIPISG